MLRGGAIAEVVSFENSVLINGITVLIEGWGKGVNFFLPSQLHEDTESTIYDKQAISGHLLCWHHDLEFLSLQNCKKYFFFSL